MRLIDLVSSSQGVLSAPLTGYPAVKYLGAQIKAALTSSSVQAAALLEYRSAARPEVLFPFMDLSVEAEALGLAIRYNESGGPDVTEHPVATPDDLAQLSVPRIQRDGRFRVFTETIERLRAESDAFVGGYAAGPFTLAGLLMSAEELAINTLTEPEVCHAVLDFTTQVAIRYGKAQAEAGAHFLVLLEPTAVLLSPELFETFVAPYVDRVSGELDLPTVLHVCGQTTKLIPSFAKCRVDGLSLDADVDLPELAPTIPEDIVLIGNIPPVRVMLDLGAGEVYQTVRELLLKIGAHGNYVASTGCDLPFEVPLENLLAFTTAVHDFNEEMQLNSR